MQHDPSYLQAVLEHLFRTDTVDFAVLGARQVIHHDHTVKLAFFAHPESSCLFHSLRCKRRVIPLYDGHRPTSFARVRHAEYVSAADPWHVAQNVSDLFGVDHLARAFEHIRCAIAHVDAAIIERGHIPCDEVVVHREGRGSVEIAIEDSRTLDR